MTLAELIDTLIDDLGLDLSRDSQDGSRGVYILDLERGRLRPVVSVEIDLDGDLILEFAP